MDAGQLSSGRLRSRLVSRGFLGSALALGGGVLMFLGWYGVSGRPVLAEQLPYLASGTIPGAALVVAAAIVLAGESTQRSTERTHVLMAELHSLLIEEASVTPAADAADTAYDRDTLVAVEGGDHYHRADCALAVGKAGMELVDSAAIHRRDLAACPVCEPDRTVA